MSFCLTIYKKNKNIHIYSTVFLHVGTEVLRMPSITYFL